MAPKSLATIDFSKKTVKAKPMNGVCNTARLVGTKYPKKDRLGDMKELEIPMTRLHDVALNNAGMELVDVSRIFPLFHLDENDPLNYNFGPTDDYLERLRSTGSEIEFKFGESIEHTKRHYKIGVPPDKKKWARICVNILRHYNDGWANGFHWNIIRAGIWEEPDNYPVLLYTHEGDNRWRVFEEEYFPLYKETALALKAAFPGIKVGGPAGCGVGAGIRLADYCRKEGVPLDFMSWDCYARDPEFIYTGAVDARRMLDERGFTKTENCIAEWHYGPHSWQAIESPEDSRQLYRELSGMAAAAFAAAMMIRMQDAPVDWIFLYCVDSLQYGFFDGVNKLKKWYVYRAFADVMRGGATRVECPSCPDRGWYAMAVENGVGKKYIFAAVLNGYGEALRLTIEGSVKPISVKTVDESRDLVQDDLWGWDDATRQLAIVRHGGDAAVWLIEVE